MFLYVVTLCPTFGKCLKLVENNHYTTWLSLRSQYNKSINPKTYL